MILFSGRGLAVFATGLLSLGLVACNGAVAPSPVRLATSDSGGIERPRTRAAEAMLPNLVLIVADDLGYGDLACYGATQIRTPNLDRLAAEGARLTQFDVPSALCTPSRGSLLTGLYPPKTGLVGNLPSGPPESGIETGPGSGGIDDNQVTLAEALKERGYATAMIGKWHLGHQRQFLPTRHGFDTYFGITNGVDPVLLLRNEDLASPSVDVDALTQAYTAEATSVIRRLKDRPFFLYFAHRSPHVPLSVPPPFLGRSEGGLYGDAVEELDWSVGEIMKTLRETGLERQTLVFFMSDNGPWLGQGSEGGSAGPFYGGKGSPYEGGLRVPAMAWWPGQIPPGRVLSDPVTSLDLFPTFVALAGGRLPSDRLYYGQDISQWLTGDVSRLIGTGADNAREFLAYVGSDAVVLRVGKWKMLRPGYWDPAPRLYDLESDPSETTDLYGARPEIVRALSEHLTTWADVVAQRAPQPKR